MKNVLLIDSGSGGINILKECVKVCPHCNYLLFCDVVNLPYGEKNKEDLTRITISNLERIRTFFNFEIVILACNTLTATVLDEMRKRYENITFIGTVPAIKPALCEFKEEDVLVLATKTTMENNILINKHKKLKKVSLNSLAPLIDENLDNLEVLKEYLQKNVLCDSKAIILGCTHYFAVKSLLEELYPNAKIFDSANGVARRLKSFVESEKEEFQVQIFCDKTENLAKFWWYYFKN